MKLLIIFLGLVNIVVGLMNIASSYIGIDVLQFAIGLSLVILGFWAVSNQADGFSWSKIASKWLLNEHSDSKINENVLTYEDGVSHGIKAAYEIVKRYDKEQKSGVNSIKNKDNSLPKISNADIALGTHSESDSADYYHEILNDIKNQKEHKKPLRNTKDIGRKDN